MASRNIKWALLETLEDLTRENFDNFCFHLELRREEPRIRRSLFEGRSRVEVVDVLVTIFPEAKAVQVTVEVLRDIGCLLEADNLAARPSAGARNLDTTAEDGHFLDEHAVQLSQRVSNISPILDDLLDRRILSQEEYETIIYLPASSDKMRELLIHCRRKGQTAKDIFYRVLEIREPYLIHDIKEKDRNVRFFNEHRAKLIQRVSNILPIIEDLFADGILGHEEYAQIRALHTSQDRMRRLIVDCRSKGSVAQDIFIRILEEHEPYLIHDLKEEDRRRFKKVIDKLETLTVKKLLFETLNDLRSEELREFKSLFEAERGFPVKSRRHLTVYIHDVMELMVEMLIPECVEVAKKVLKKMNRSDLVQKWLASIPVLKEKQQPPLIPRVETRASLKDLLTGTLNDFSDDELKIFKRFLEFDVAQKFLPDISSMLRLTEDRAEIVEMMVQTYGQQSVELTSGVVEKMSRTDLLLRLSKFSSGLKGPSGNLELDVEKMASVLELLLETLAALSDEELQQFKRVLRHHIHSNRRFLDIPLLLLETTGRRDTVFSVVLTWGQKAEETTTEILKKMDRTDLVQRLSDGKTEPKKKHSDEHRAALIQRVAEMAAVKKLLLETLTFLSEKELQKFKGDLELIVSQKDLPDIFRMLRQTSNRADMVDLMVQTYGQMSVDLSREILFNMNRIDLTQTLSGLKEKHSVDEHQPALLERAEGMSAVKHVVLETLKDLSNEELQEFKWLLQLTYFQKGLPHISWSRLDWADSAGALVDLMVENQQPMEVTKKVFMDMNRPDLVERVTETSSELEEKHPSEPRQKEVTTTSMMEMLLKMLQDLNYGEFEQFKWLLQHTERGKDLPRTPTDQMEKAERGEIAALMVEAYGQQCVEVTKEVLMKMNSKDLVQRFSEIILGAEGPSGSLELEGCGSSMQVSSDWTKLEPEVNSTDEFPTYSLQSEAGNFECCVSGLRWVCKDKVSFRYQFCSLNDHMERIESMQYMPAGPLMDITVIAGTLDVVYIPHWIYVDDNTLLDKFAVLHIDDCGVTVEKVTEVTSSHVKLCEPHFSLTLFMVKLGFSVEIKGKVFVYKTNKPFLKLHVYLIPPDPALIKELEKKKKSFGYEEIPIQHPRKPLKMNSLFILSAHLNGEEMASDEQLLEYESVEPNFYKLFIRNPDTDLELQLRQKNEPRQLWTYTILKEEYQNTRPVQDSSTGPCGDATNRNTGEQSPIPGPSGNEHRSAQLQETTKDKERLLYILKRLSDEKFEEFKWHLVNLNDIFESELEKKERGDVVNKIWDTYSQRSIEVTKTVLKKISKNNLVAMLSGPS